ncbi:hypothetical protein LINPERHAP2_LOCUS21053 [Linum perenne]
MSRCSFGGVLEELWPLNKTCGGDNVLTLTNAHSVQVFLKPSSISSATAQKLQIYGIIFLDLVRRMILELALGTSLIGFSMAFSASLPTTLKDESFTGGTFGNDVTISFLMKIWFILRLLHIMSRKMSFSGSPFKMRFLRTTRLDLGKSLNILVHCREITTEATTLLLATRIGSSSGDSVCILSDCKTIVDALLLPSSEWPISCKATIAAIVDSLCYNNCHVFFQKTFGAERGGLACKMLL